LLMVPVIILTPLAWRPVVSLPEEAADREAASPPKTPPHSGGDHSGLSEVEQRRDL